MAISSPNQHPQAGVPRGDGSERAASPADVKGMLHQIATHLVDSDRRHTDALRDMQDRITGLGKRAADAREQAPAEAMPAFERIESSMAQLAERIDATTRSMDASGDDPWSLHDAEALSAVYDQAGLKPSVHGYDAMPAHEPADWPLPSYPFTSSAPPAFVPADPIPAPVPAAEPPVPVAEPVVVAPTIELPREMAMAADDKDWLDSRLTASITKLQEAIVAAQPDEELGALSRRIELIEQRLTEATSAAVTRADLEGLRVIEQQVSELAGQFDKSRQQLQRLDAIEQEIRELAVHLSDDRLQALSTSAKPSTGDYEAMAGLVAGIVGTEIKSQFKAFQPAAAPPAIDAHQINEIRGILETIMNEQRQGDEQTAGILDTMQQALIGLLDRVDAIELNQGGAAAGSPRTELSADRYSAEDIADEPAEERYSPTQRPAVPQTPTAASAVAAAPAAGPASPSAPQPATRRAAVVDPAPRTEPPRELANDIAPLAAAGSPQDDDAEDAAAEVRPSEQQSGRAARKPMRMEPEEPTKDQFIAAARRAMRQAQAQKKLDELSEEDTTAEVAEGIAARAGGKGKLSRAAVLAGESGQKRLLDRRILAAAVALAVLGLGYQLVLKPMRAARAPDIQSQVQRQLITPETIERERAEAEDAGASRGDSAIPGKSDSLAPTPTIRQATPAPQGGKADPSPAASSPSTQARPSQPRAKRPAPETLVDELSDRREVIEDATPEQRDAQLDRPASPYVPAGIMLQQTEAVPSVNELIRARDRQTVAALSGQLGAAQREPIVGLQLLSLATPEQSRPMEVVTAIETAQPDRQARLQPASVTVEEPARASATVDVLPPQIGPNSLRLAAQGGDPSAEFEVAARFAEGKGIQQDFKRAVAWYQRAASRGYAIAQFRLGAMYERGLGVITDAERAKVWYQRAAEQGNVKAMHNLAVLIAGRNPDNPDYAGAAPWFQKAAEHGLADSQFNLAVLYEGGLGVAADKTEAYRWLALAARSGDRQALKRREVVRLSLSPKVAAAIDKELETWQHRPADKIANDARVAGDAWRNRGTTASVTSRTSLQR